MMGPWYRIIPFIYRWKQEQWGKHSKSFPATMPRWLKKPGTKDSCRMAPHTTQYLNLVKAMNANKITSTLEGQEEQPVYAGFLLLASPPSIPVFSGSQSTSSLSLLHKAARPQSHHLPAGHLSPSPPLHGDCSLCFCMHVYDYQNRPMKVLKIWTASNIHKRCKRHENEVND